MTDAAIGIDLGTTYSCVGISINDKVEIIANEQGNRTTASYVSFTETEILVGDAGQNQIANNPDNTIFDSKRLIGRSFDDESVQQDMKRWSFKVVDVEGTPKVQVEHQEETKFYSAEEISAMVLEKMRGVAEAYLGKPVRNTVLTVPASFNDSQRESTKKAGKMAGLNVLRIINEATAAAIAYGIDKLSPETERKTLIFDLGGGTFDVSILSIKNGEFSVLATEVDEHLGGENFDNRMVSHFVQEFKRKYKQDLTTNARSIRRLRVACERAKRTLSNGNQANIEIDSLFDGIDFYTTITRARFDELNGDLFRATVECVEAMLEGAGLEASMIDDVVMIGGSSRIPRVQRLVQELFEGGATVLVNKGVQCDEAVAYGAAMCAAQAVLMGGELEESCEGVVSGLAGVSVGVEVAGGVMDVVVARNAAVPCKIVRSFTTLRDNQSSVMIKIFEGEHPLTKDNNSISRVELSGIAPAPRGVPEIEVTFDMDSNGVLRISAVDASTGKENNVTVTNDKRSGRLCKEDIDAMVANAGDMDEQARLVARMTLDSYVCQMRMTMEDERLVGKVNEADRVAVLGACVDSGAWLADRKSADAGKDELVRRFAELREFCAPFVARMSGH